MSSQGRSSRGSRLQKLRQRQDYPNPEHGTSENGGWLEAVPNDHPHRNPQRLPVSNRNHTATRDTPATTSNNEFHRNKMSTSTLDPYIGKLERYELFCTNQSYYLVGCNKLNTAYRVLKMDRTLIERPVATEESYVPRSPAVPEKVTPVPTTSANAANNNAASATTTPNAAENQAIADSAHKSKPSLRPLSEFLTEDGQVYSQEEIQDMLDMIHDGNRLRRADRAAGDGSGQSGGGLKPIAKAYGIVGFVRFLDCYYLTLITRRAKVGSIGGNGIYSIKNTETFPIKPAERVPGSTTDMDVHADPSSVLLSMWNRGKRSVGLGLTNREIAELRYQGLYQVVDLTKNFFFSYTYDLTRSLQENFLSTSSQPFPPPPFKDMYAWNYFLTRELEACTNSLTSFHWVMPIIHGAFVQRKLNDYGRSLNVILIARRSRHFAGTRYLKRGVSEQGKVANDVEHEQILHDESRSASNSIFSSYLQVRGSIPTFWTQESSVTIPKPPIELNRVDPTYTATQLHFEDLLKRYGSPIVVLDLVKQSEKREREVRVGNEFRHAVDYVNTSVEDNAHKIRYCALDYSHISKHRNLDVSTSLKLVSTFAVNQTGFFCSAPKWKIMEGGSIEPFSEQDFAAAALLPQQFGVPVFPMEQTGVLRTNCIDCLDRTNVAQFSAGVEAMEQQLVVMGIRSSAKLDPSSNIVRVLIDMYVDIGDQIALQYGGSEAHKKVSAEKSESNIAGPIGKHRELLTSIRRYYSNAFTDRLKQDAMNLFLGYYVPYRHTVPLWEMETDYYLHNFHVKTGKGTLHSMKGYQRAFGVVEWNDEDDGEFSANEKKSSSSAIAVSRVARPNRPLARSSTANSNDSSKQEGESRIAKVQRRCRLQNQALSAWWKIAIQSNIQRRMWMQLSRSPAEESLLPPRFERLYQPEKMAQFDRFFARSWATPVRRTHPAQQSEGSDGDEDTSEFRRNISGRSLPTPKQAKPSGSATDWVPGGLSLQSFVEDYGFDPPVVPSMKMFIERHGISGQSSSTPPNSSTSVYPYLGDLRPVQQPPEEYLRYVSQTIDYSSIPFEPQTVEEFKECLNGLSLSSDDVHGIRELAESAHIGRSISSGPYRGLFQDESAIEVATVIQEQFNALDNMRNRGELRDGMPTTLTTELRRRGLQTPGVKGAIAAGWNRHVVTERQYSESFLDSSADCRRSVLTTTNSMKLYSSFFPPDMALRTADLTFMLGGQPSQFTGESKTGPTELASMTSSFVAKAARVGIHIPSHSDLMESKSAPLFPYEQRRSSVPAGFEMINEDMFARKDNKFMVFNGAGVDSWTGNGPVTKISGIESMLLGTLG